MPTSEQVEAPGAKDLVTFTVKADGAALPGTVRVTGVSIYKAIGRLSYARIEVADGDPAAQTFEASNLDTLVPGVEVEVLAGYRSEEEPVFKGLVVSQQIRVREGGPSELVVVCRHPLFKSTLTRRSRSFANQTDDAAMESLFSEYSVTLDNSADALPEHESLVQFQVTDWDFALARAESNGLFLTPTDDGATLAPPDLSAEPVLALSFGATILALDAQIDARTQPTEATGLAWDPSAQEALTASGAEPTVPEAGNLDGAALANSHEQAAHHALAGAVPQEELEALTSARLQHARLRRFTGRVRCEGTPLAVPGALADLQGLGDRFSGHHLISGVRHTLRAGSWTTDLQIGLPDEPLLERGEEIAGPAAGGAIPPIEGLHPGTVVAIHDDPASELRVQVALPALGEDAEPVWSRLAQFDAGEGRGAFFYPEVDDEVVVGFLGNDPRHPVVLGSLYSSARTAELAPAEDNFEKGYISREGLRFLFNDETKAILLETPNGNTVELSDDEGGIRLEDEHGNKIVLNADGVLIESASELAVSSSADTKLEAGANLQATAGAEFKAEGSGAAELSAGGTTTVKGAMVNIN